MPTVSTVSGKKVLLRYDEKNHWPIYDNKKFRSRCKLPKCSFFSHIYCQKCEKHLCLTSKRNCFYTYHCSPIKLKQLEQKMKKAVMIDNKKLKQRSTRSTDVPTIAQQSGPKPRRSRRQAEKLLDVGKRQQLQFGQHGQHSMNTAVVTKQSEEKRVKPRQSRKKSNKPNEIGKTKSHHRSSADNDAQTAQTNFMNGLGLYPAQYIIKSFGD